MSATPAPVTVAVPTHPEPLQIRHTCNRLLMVVSNKGLELACDKCKSKVVYSWRHILMMMLTADMSEPSPPGPQRQSLDL